MLRGVSFEVPQGGVVALLGANGAGKSTTLKSVSTLLASERGAVTKGSIEFRGQRIDQLAPGDLVGMGMIQVMEGRHCFAHLSVEDNLITGAYSRPINNAQVREELDRIYAYFPKLKGRRASLAGYTAGGEQQMVAIGRAMMARPKMLLLDEPSMAWRRRWWPRSSRSSASSIKQKASASRLFAACRIGLQQLPREPIRLLAQRCL